jgi:hypothetical protein
MIAVNLRATIEMADFVVEMFRAYPNVKMELNRLLEFDHKALPNKLYELRAYLSTKVKMESFDDRPPIITLYMIRCGGHNDEDEIATISTKEDDDGVQELKFEFLS